MQVRLSLEVAFDVPRGSVVEDGQIRLPDGTVLEAVLGLWDAVTEQTEATETGYAHRWGVTGVEYVDTSFEDEGEDESEDGPTINGEPYWPSSKS